MTRPASLAARPDLVAPRTLARLRRALAEGDGPGRLLATIRRLERWLEGPPDQAPAGAWMADRALLGQAAGLLRSAAARAMGLHPGPDWAERAAAFDARPHSPEEEKALARYLRLRAIKDGLEPVRPEAEQDPELRASLDALHSRQVALQADTMPGQVRAESLRGLDALLADYDRLRSAARADDPALPYLDFHAASAAFALGRGRTLNGELARASAAYATAADRYARAGEPDQALKARDEAERTRFAQRADVDGAAMPDLVSMATGISDPMERARALVRLSDRARDANDAFSAHGHAEAALVALAEAGYPEPVAGQLPDALDRWIDAGTARNVGNALVRELQWVGLEMVRARALRWSVRPERHDGAEQQVSDLLVQFVALLLDEQRAVAADVRAGLVPYGIVLDDAEPEASGATERATALLRRIGDTSDPAEAEALVGEARAFDMPALAGQACLQLALLRLDRGDAAGAVAAALNGEAALLAGREPHALVGLREFDILLELRRQRAGALAITGDAQAVFDCAWPTVQLMEAARYRVSSPVQQASFLAQRTAFYELAAFSAFRLGRWDDLLVAMDLFKARSALRNRLAPPPDETAQALARKLAEVTRALAHASSEERPALAARRRAIWDLLTVVRLGRADPADLPELGVAAIQAILRPDEAAISWAFVGTGVLLVLALTHDGLHAERVVMSEAEQALLGDYVAALESGRVKNRALGRTISQLAGVILPERVRGFVASARRLILSPHRQLNLLPLHAAHLDGAWLIERAAIRYVPNLGSLLLSWRGGGVGVVALGLDRTRLAGWPPLAHAESEALAVAAAWREAGQPVTCLTGEEVTVDAVTGLDLSTARSIHLATHGSSVLLGEARADPFASHLVLRDGVLDALAIAQLDLRAEVVVMSACFSGQRSLALGGLAELPGDDMFGLQAAFLQAGAHSVIGALWPLVDDVAGRLLPALHERLARGVAPDLALQDVLRTEIGGPAPPDVYSWGALFLSSIGRMEEEDLG